jgi:hypothetical protein
MTLATGLPCWLAAGRVHAAEHPIASYAGTYRYVGGQKQIARMHEAVDEVCRDLNFVLRNFAQPRLEQGLRPVPRVTFQVTGSHTTISRPGIPTMAGNANGGRFSWVDKRGIDTKVNFKWKGDTLRVVCRQSDGHSVLDWRFRDEGRLGFRMKIVHEKLSKPLSYSYSYKR